ncbi:MAG: hypothetical protein JNM93_13080 [Bacteriovoracaceae bacterium]|nr:hypothetical protein [Bacteriovoracaceae bacterium]
MTILIDNSQKHKNVFFLIITSWLIIPYNSYAKNSYLSASIGNYEFFGKFNEALERRDKEYIGDYGRISYGTFSRRYKALIIFSEISFEGSEKSKLALEVYILSKTDTKMYS